MMDFATVGKKIPGGDRSVTRLLPDFGEKVGVPRFGGSYLEQSEPGADASGFARINSADLAMAGVQPPLVDEPWRVITLPPLVEVSNKGTFTGRTVKVRAPLCPLGLDGVVKRYPTLNMPRAERIAFETRPLRNMARREGGISRSGDTWVNPHWRIAAENLDLRFFADSGENSEGGLIGPPQFEEDRGGYPRNLRTSLRGVQISAKAAEQSKGAA